MKWYRLACLVLCLCVVQTTVWAKIPEKTLDLYVRQFNSVVFVHEHGKTGAEAKPLIKWQEPVLYSPAGTLTKKQVNNFFRLMKQVQKLTKLNMRMVKKGEKAKLIIYFVPKEKLAKEVKKGINCIGKIKVDKAFRIKRAYAKIPSNRPDKTDHCLVEETVQLFGLANDSTIIKDSMFNEKSTRTSLSTSDKVLLKALYDPRLKTGMTKQQAQPFVRTVIKDILEKAARR